MDSRPIIYVYLFQCSTVLFYITQFVRRSSSKGKSFKLFSFPLTHFAPMCLSSKNTVISPDFQVWKFCGRAQFPYSFGWFARNYVETVPFCKISTPRNQVKLRYFLRCVSLFQCFPAFWSYYRIPISKEIKWNIGFIWADLRADFYREICKGN